MGAGLAAIAGLAQPTVMRPAPFATLLLALLIGAACGGALVPLADVEPSTLDLASLPPIELPRDEAPHRNLTEWWYFTGHLQDDAGRTYGFEFVVFQSSRENAPLGYAAHFALTDQSTATFRFDQRTAIRGSPEGGPALNLCVGGWSLRRADGAFLIAADMPGGALERVLRPRKPAVLQHQDGVLDFRPYGWSYYYSYTRLAVEGRLRLDERDLQVSGRAWMDHQWGDFVTIVAAGWDWFSVQLDDGRDLMVTLIRGEQGALTEAYGTLVDVDGRARHLAADDFELDATGSWTSPASGATYPSGWRLRVLQAGLDLSLRPVMRAQELDARASAGLFYWEGAVEVQSKGVTVGRGYTELTGYAGGAVPTDGRGLGAAISDQAACPAVLG